MILETERLVLKPYEIEFADEIYEVVKHKEIADTMVMIPHPYPREVVDQWISYLQKSCERGTAFEFAIFLKGEEPRYIGNCGLVSISKNHRNAEVGYFIDVNEWGKGYATEACKKIIEYGFEEHQLNRICCMVRNSASRKVMEKSGMVWEGRLKQEFLKDDVYEDMDYLAILADEYYKS
ncbi:N-acetyltransferase [Lysinibacillus sp. 2017]|uniref:GNAT family N-acetyltransferase n=1 Tax=unclassified Lysinibacillus TaxID=2636778 RepID=UPI000D526F6B|nr:MULTISPECIES: GNAT family N-acetyltransferase [unclassified Lysinibacillus]AWE07203.1 N-acetyltransferase [Lysinibacillus sp. 2017]TGN34661.1 N-acetyltransferase [Lysinibacillus sp. S2017]